MCIVCQIKADLKKSKASVEEAQAVLTNVEKLARALVGTLDAAQQINDRLPEAEKFSAAEVEAFAEAERLFKLSGDGMADALLSLLAVLGGADIKAVQVNVGDDESLSDAIARTLADNEASTSAFTKSKLH